MSQKFFLIHLDVYEAYTPLGEKYMDILTEAELTFSQIVELYINRYGAITLYFLVPLVAIMLIMKMSISWKEKDEPERMNFTYGMQLLAAFLISALFWFGYFIEFDVLRISRFAILMAVVLNGLMIYPLIERISSNRTSKSILPLRETAISLIILLLIASATLSVFNVYNSPRVSEANFQVTNMDITGMWKGSIHREPVHLTNKGSIHRELFLI